MRIKNYGKSKLVPDMMNFYYPGWGLSMRLKSEQASLQTQMKKIQNTRWRRGQYWHHLYFRESSRWYTYETMFENFGFLINLKEIDNYAYFENTLDIAWDDTKKNRSMFRMRTEPTPVDFKVDIVANWSYKRRKLTMRHPLKSWMFNKLRTWCLN